MSVRAAVIGYGLAGRYLHAPIMAASGIEIAAIVTSRTSEPHADFPGAEVLASAGEACARSDIDLVVVATPDHLHEPQARMALEAGKHVVVDKPFALTSADARALADLADARGRVLSVYQNRRWDADFLTVRGLIESGALGDVLTYIARWDRFRPSPKGGWRESGGAGVLHDLGPHLIDQALVLFGVPDWLQADVLNQTGIAIPNDGFEIRMGRGKLRISLGVTMMAADEARFTRVLGSRAAFVKAGLDPQEAHLRERKPLNDPAYGADAEMAWGVLTDETGEKRMIPTVAGDWRAFYRSAREAIETGGPPPVTARDAARVIGVIEAAIESATRGIRIALPEFLSARGVL